MNKKYIIKPSFTNRKIEELYNKIDGLNNIIDQQALEISQLKEQKKQAIEEIEHELNGHILIGDEISWNEEYYTDGKLDYKKLLIGILQTILEILGGKENE